VDGDFFADDPFCFADEGGEGFTSAMKEEEQSSGSRSRGKDRALTGTGKPQEMTIHGFCSRQQDEMPGNTITQNGGRTVWTIRKSRRNIPK
jgi:hypothetical protein